MSFRILLGSRKKKKIRLCSARRASRGPPAPGTRDASTANRPAETFATGEDRGGRGGGVALDHARTAVGPRGGGQLRRGFRACRPRRVARIWDDAESGERKVSEGRDSTRPRRCAAGGERVRRRRREGTRGRRTSRGAGKRVAVLRTESRRGRAA